MMDYLSRPRFSRRRIATALFGVGITLLLLMGMGADTDCDKDKKPQDAPELSSDEKRAKDNLQRLVRAREAVMQGTIGELAYFPPRPGVVVEGYGVVAGLGTNGSSEVPEKIRDELKKQMLKDPRLKDADGRSVIPNPDKWLRSLDNAVVAVSGVIPYGASAGDSFDLDVEALPQTQTVSLEGGWLYETPLGFRPFPDPVGLKATGAGPIFLNPHNRPLPTTTQASGFIRKTPQLRRGKVLGGGLVKRNQQVRLVLVTPSYNRASTIRNRINSRFPSDKPVAEAISPSFIEIRVPPEWREKLDHFLALITHLYVRDDGSYLEMQAKKLVEVIQQSDPPYADISLLWEGLGRPMLPMLQQLYGSPNKGVSFFAARSGLRIGDPAAVDVIAGFAQAPSGRYRDLACVELGNIVENLRPEAARALAKMLGDPDLRLRIIAYEALLKTQVQGTGLVSVWVEGGEYWLDVVDCPPDAAPLIYGWQMRQQRIAVFGPKLSLHRPCFYVSPDESVTLAGEIGEKTIRVTRKMNRRSTPALSAPADVPGLVHFLGASEEAVDKDKPLGPNNVAGVALSYTQVLTVLMQLCQEKVIDAQFTMQEPTPPAPGMLGIKGPRPEKDSRIPGTQPTETQPSRRDFDREPESSSPKSGDADLINFHDADQMQGQPVLQPAEEKEQ